MYPLWNEFGIRAWDKINEIMIYNVEYLYDGCACRGIGKPWAFGLTDRFGKDIDVYDTSLNTESFGENIDNPNIVLMKLLPWKDKNNLYLFEKDLITASWGYGKESTTAKIEEFYYHSVECTLSEDIEIIGTVFTDTKIV